MTESTRSFRGGLATAKEAARNTPIRLVDFFTLEEDKDEFVHFLLEPDEWISVDVHQMYPTKGKPEGYEGNWPKVMSPICRKSKMADGLPIEDDCYCCEHPQLNDGKVRRPSHRTFSLLVIRDEVREDGKRKGFTDRMKTVAVLGEDGKPTGEEKTVPDIRIVELGWQNFYSKLEGPAEVFGTVLNQEFNIKKTGKNLDTDYAVTGLGPTNVWDDAKLAEKYGVKIVDGVRIWPKDYDLSRMVMNRASDEFYARWIDPSKSVASNGKTTDEVVKPTGHTEATQATLEAMRARVMETTQAKVD